MKHCFIMQPFDKGKFDKRYIEIIEPTVIECGYLPYRVDRDESAEVLIDTIEKNDYVQRSMYCRNYYRQSECVV